MSQICLKKKQSIEQSSLNLLSSLMDIHFPKRGHFQDIPNQAPPGGGPFQFSPFRFLVLLVLLVKISDLRCVNLSDAIVIMNCAMLLHHQHGLRNTILCNAIASSTQSGQCSDIASSSKHMSSFHWIVIKTFISQCNIHHSLDGLWASQEGPTTFACKSQECRLAGLVYFH